MLRAVRLHAKKIGLASAATAVLVAVAVVFGPMLPRSASTICCEDYTDLVPGTYANDTLALQACFDASSAGDTVRLGKDCDEACSDDSCDADLYWVGVAGTANVTAPHGITIDGEGSEIKLTDQGDAEWSSWRWECGLVVNEDLTAGTVATTTIRDLTVNMNEDGQSPGEDQSKQRGLHVLATTTGSAQQAVTISNVDAKSSTWAGISIGNDVDVASTTTTSQNCHHGYQLSGSNVELSIDGHTSGQTYADDVGIKLESYNDSMVVEVKNSTLYAPTDNNLVWGGYESGSLTVDNITATCPTSGTDRRCISVAQEEATITIKNSTLTGTDGYKVIGVGNLGATTTIQDTTIAGGYISIGVTSSWGTASVVLDGVAWTGEGYLRGGNYFGVFTYQQLDTAPTRLIDITDCDAGADNDSLLWLYGSEAEIDSATITTYNTYGNPQEDEVIRAACAATYTCEVTWPSGNHSDTASFWCGDDVASSCEW